MAFVYSTDKSTIHCSLAKLAHISYSCINLTASQLFCCTMLVVLTRTLLVRFPLLVTSLPVCSDFCML